MPNASTDPHAWLAAPVSAVPAVTKRAATTLAEVFEIRTVRDLLEHYPHADKYRDIGPPAPVASAELGTPITVVGHIVRWQVDRPRGRRLVIARATVVDDEGGRVEVPFFNQEWRPGRTPAGTRVAVSGQLEAFRGKRQLRNPQLVVLTEGEDFDESQRIQPTYPATEGLSSQRIAGFVAAALDALPRVPDFLPEHLRRRHRLVDLDTAMRAIHRPADMPQVRAARKRLTHDELLCLQVGLQQRRHRLEAEAIGLSQPPLPDGLAAAFVSKLPFPLTGAQQRALEGIGADLDRAKPMHRLLQGDVGSGKTVVEAWVMLCAVDHGSQGVLMAPTENLAEQHFRTLTDLLAPLGVNAPGGPRLELLTGGASQSRLRAVLAGLVAGDIQLVVGTHALLEERVMFADLGVVVIDEQHRFGVEHRARLRDKRRDGKTPDVLVSTATPIPRSLALTLYGDLDVTVLDELPPGRQPVHTEVIGADSQRRARLYDYIRERVAEGERAYVVCPLIEESDALGLAAAENVHRKLADEVFADLRVGLVHGRLPADERDAVMDAFRRGDTPILVATTVIEVGVDVAEASIMVVEDADRFGISQLHQLRGRVGRGAARSYCVLFSAEPSGNPRLEALARTTDGFELAEEDLKLRGEGSLFDTRQSGLPDLKLARLARDTKLISQTRDDARLLIESDPDLASLPDLRDEVARRYGEQRLAELRTG